MTYDVFMENVYSELVLIDTDTNKWYVDPKYAYKLRKDFNIKDIEDFDDVTYDIIGENLKIYVDIHNSRISKVDDVADWMYDIINTVIDSSVVDEENKIFETLIEKMNKEKESK